MYFPCWLRMVLRIAKKKKTKNCRGNGRGGERQGKEC